MRTFRAKIHEAGGHYLEPQYTASDEFWVYNDPKEFLMEHWGLGYCFDESWEIVEVMDDGSERQFADSGEVKKA